MQDTKSIIKIYGLLFFFLLANFSCKTNKKMAKVTTANKQETFMNPPVIIYKTKKDYFNQVPIGLSEDKKSVVSYPDKVDVYHSGKLATPTLLANGYLLDNRGISVNSAFLKYTYEDYSQFISTPTADNLFLQIIDSDPFTEIHFCKCTRDTVELNRIIREGLSTNCKKIK
jgi:hypothetical protein